jgi:23S rRNA (adenine2503-C2)-methyltransferase
MNSIRDFDEQGCIDLIESLSEKKFRAKQLFQWIHQKGISSYDEMSNLPKSLVAALEERFIVNPLKVVKRSISQNDGTEKVLFSLPDEELIETVVMKYRYGNSVCISTQVGCRMGCKFCASTIGGLKRNLTAGEMLSQVYESNKNLDERINHIVLMGSGEPLENYDEVVRFLRMINHPQGYNLSLRNITLSTCGLVNQIRRLAKENLPITLAISLHGATNEVREKLMPVNKRYPIEDIISAVDDYIEQTNRRVTFEYALIRNLNDSNDQAVKLSKLLRGKLVHVNLIPINEVEENEFLPSSEKQISSFKSILEKTGINVTLRRELGSDINAACGQLRNSVNPNKIEIIRKF